MAYGCSGELRPRSQRAEPTFTEIKREYTVAKAKPPPPPPPDAARKPEAERATVAVLERGMRMSADTRRELRALAFQATPTAPVQASKIAASTSEPAKKVEPENEAATVETPELDAQAAELEPPTVEPKPELAELEPKKVEPAKPETAKHEPAKPEPTKPEPAMLEPQKPEPAKVEPAKREPLKLEPPKVERANAKPLELEAPKPEPAKPELPKPTKEPSAPPKVEEVPPPKIVKLEPVEPHEETDELPMPAPRKALKPPPPAKIVAPPRRTEHRPKRPTPMSPQQATHHLANAWEKVTGHEATLEVISVFWGQWALETGRGRWMVDYNYAGLKGVAPDGGWAYWWTWEETPSGPHRVRARFRNYESAAIGAEDYVRLLWRLYPKAVAAAREGNAAKFIQELVDGGFFTEIPKHYTRSVVSLAAEFRRDTRALRL